jgi:hypothetical protein
MADSDRDVRWMTYAEAAAALGVNPESVARRMRRGGWAKRRGNDGKPRVAVPVNVLPPVPVSVPVSVRDGGGYISVSVPDSAKFVPDSNLAAIAAVFREEQDRLRCERDEAQAALAHARERAGRAEGESAALRESVAREVAARQAAEAERDASRQALAEWEAGGPLARALRAFLYRRP